MRNRQSKWKYLSFNWITLDNARCVLTKYSIVKFSNFNHLITLVFGVWKWAHWTEFIKFVCVRSASRMKSFRLTFLQNTKTFRQTPRNEVALCSNWVTFSAERSVSILFLCYFMRLTISSNWRTVKTQEHLSKMSEHEHHEVTWLKLDQSREEKKGECFNYTVNCMNATSE